MAKFEHSQDPDAIAAKMQRIVGRSLVLGLDLGTSTGYSATWWKPGDPVDPEKLAITCGQLDLSAGAYDSGGIRFVRLRHFLNTVRPAALFYEMVRNTPAEAITKFNAAGLLARTATAAQLFGAFQGVLSGWAEENDVPCTSFSIGTIKKRATGRGSADKPAVIAAANKMFGLELDPEGHTTSGTDNVADATFVMLLGLEQYGAGLHPEADVA